MFRLSSALLCAIFMLAGACHKNAAEQPEPAGTLEGVWIVGLTDIVKYDAQNNVLAVYPPAADVMGYTQLTFTSSTLEEYHVRKNTRATIPYVRTGDELTCPSPATSYTIRKLTARNLDLYFRGEYIQFGTSVYRNDFTIHLQRQ